MTTTAVDDSLVGLEHRQNEVKQHGLPQGEAERQGADDTKVELGAWARRVQGVTLLSLLVVVQAVWIGLLVYGGWALVFKPLISSG